MGKNAEQRKGATDEELRKQRTDVMTGMFFSNFIMYFIILTTAATLHAHGQTHISPAREAAEALRRWRKRGLLVVHPGLDWHGNAGGAGAGGLLRLCHLGGGALAGSA